MKPAVRRSVVIPPMRKRLACGILFAVLASCGGSRPPAPSAPTEGEPRADDRTEIEKRRDVACEQLGPRLTQCAVEDARAELEAGRTSKADFEANTTPDVQRALTAEWLKKCRVDMSSRQVRVLEVCFREEQACGPLLSCLEHLNAK